MVVVVAVVVNHCTRSLSGKEPSSGKKWSVVCLIYTLTGSYFAASDVDNILAAHLTQSLELSAVTFSKGHKFDGHFPDRTVQKFFVRNIATLVVK